MSLKLFEQFLQSEITRHPSLANALKWKGGLRLCSQLFDEAVADLHYRLIRRAVQLLFTRANATQLRQLSANCDASCSGGGGGFGDGGLGSSCETKYIGSDSSRTATPSKNNRDDCSPMSRCTSPSGDVGIDNNDARWEAQSNNFQSLRQTPRSPANHGGGLGCCGTSGGCGGGGNSGNNSRWTRTKDARQPPQQQCQQQQQQQQQCPPQSQFCQPQPQPPVPERKPPAVCSAPAPAPSKPPTPPRPQAQQSAASLPSPHPQTAMVREGPAYNYPTTGKHNRHAMAGWYVANMDALLSNMMRLFEKIYADTLRMCGASPGAVKELRNALPDPTLLSMQQRAGGAWRPNYMTCKIDFLLHIAAMVYRNTHDLRCGCRCPEPADPCSAWSEQSQFPQQQEQQQQQQQQQKTCQQPQVAAVLNHRCAGHTANRNNAAAAAVVTVDEFEDIKDNIGDSCDWQRCQGRLPQRQSCTVRALPEESSWEQPNLLNNSSSNARRQLQKDRQKLRRPTLQQQQQQQQQYVVTVHKSRALVCSKDIRTNSSAISAAASLHSGRASKRASVRKKQRHRQSCQKPNRKQPEALLAVQRSRTFMVSEDIDCSSSEDISTSANSSATSGSDTSKSVSADRTNFRLSIDEPK